jgi:hypothetical protein
MIFLFQNQTDPPPGWDIFRGLQGVVEALELVGEHLASLGMLNLVQACPTVSPQLFGRIGVSASAASPFCVWSCHSSCARAARATFAGTERHHQIATALQALSSCHNLLSLQRQEFSGHNCTQSAAGANHSENASRREIRRTRKINLFKIEHFLKKGLAYRDLIWGQSILG